MRDSFLRVAAVAPRVAVADSAANVAEIKRLAAELHAQGVELAVFPEMCVTGYTCADLFHSATLLDDAERCFTDLLAFSATIEPMAFVVGLPVRTATGLLNAAALICSGRAMLTAKTYVPNYNEFYERRWWQPVPADGAEVTLGGERYTVRPGAVASVAGARVGIEICEDLWVPVPPSAHLAMAGAQVICNLSASDDLIGKYAYLRDLVAGQSARCMCGYVYAGAGWGESSTDLVFDGKGIIAENGAILAEKERWNHSELYVIADLDIQALDRDRMHMTTFADCAVREGNNVPDVIPVFAAAAITPEPPAALLRKVSATPFVPAHDDAIDERCTEIVNIQSAALARRLDAIACRNLVVGISGGLDSTLALLVAVRAFDSLGLDRKGIHGITMPGFGTTGRTHSNAVKLMESLDVSMREIPIAEAVSLHFDQIGHDATVHDVTYENSQARYRTLLLMDIANQTGGIVLGTGDLSELALGWATYNGDHMSMYGVNAGVPKTLVRYLVRWFADRADDAVTGATLRDIIDTPVSPELLPAAADGTIAQRTEDLVGPYELHDFFLYYTLRFGFTPQRIYYLATQAFAGRPEYPAEVIGHWLKVFCRRFFTQQFKRSCMPDGPKVGSVCLSPRGDWRMPSDASPRAWL